MALYRVWIPERGTYVYINEDQLPYFSNASIYRRRSDGTREELGTPEDNGFRATGGQPDIASMREEEGEPSYVNQVIDIINEENDEGLRNRLLEDLNVVTNAPRERFRDDDVRRSRARLNQYLDFAITGSRSPHYSVAQNSNETYPGSEYGLRPLIPAIFERAKTYPGTVEGSDRMLRDAVEDVVSRRGTVAPLNEWGSWNYYQSGGGFGPQFAVGRGDVDISDNASIDQWAREAARNVADSWRAYQDFYDIPYDQVDYNNYLNNAYDTSLREFARMRLDNGERYPVGYSYNLSSLPDEEYVNYMRDLRSEAEKIRSYNAANARDPFRPIQFSSGTRMGTGRINGVDVNVGGEIAAENNKGYDEMIRYIAERGGTTPEKLRPVMNNLMTTILNEESGGTHNDWVIGRSTTADGYYQNVLGTANDVRNKIRRLSNNGYDFSGYLDAAKNPFSRTNRVSRLSPENQLVGASGVFAYWDRASEELGRIANSYDPNNPMAVEPALRNLFVRYYGGAGNNAKLASHFGNRFNAYYTYLYGDNPTEPQRLTPARKVPVNPNLPIEEF